MTTVYGVPQATGYVDQWRPVRFVREPQQCYLCWVRIPKASPGAKSGTRGTKAFYEPNLRLWECLGCREEQGRAELARMDTQGGTAA